MEHNFNIKTGDIENANEASEYFERSANSHSVGDTEKNVNEGNQIHDPDNKMKSENSFDLHKQKNWKDAHENNMPNFERTSKDKSTYNRILRLIWAFLRNLWLNRGRKVKKKFARNVLEEKERACMPNSFLQNTSELGIKLFQLACYLISFGRSSEEKDEVNPSFKGNPTSEGVSTAQALDNQEMNKNPDINTLEDALSFFDLTAELKTLEESLEAVRKKKKSEKGHEDCFNEIDKKIIRMSIKYHPDKIKNSDVTESKKATPQNLQAALNALRKALKFLNSAFLEDISTDHYFSFYTKLNVSSVCNDDKMANQIFGVTWKMSMISQIKHEHIITEIRNFLIKSKDCIQSYHAEKFNDFVTASDIALLHIKSCIEGFKKLCREIKKVKEQCKSEENRDNMISELQCMASKCERDLKHLQLLEISMKKKYQFFIPEEDIDPYFVLPFVFYTNVIVMCNVMVKNKEVSYEMASCSEAHPHFSNELNDLIELYCLTSYCSGNKYHEETLIKIMNKEQPTQGCSKQQLTIEKVKLEFNERLKKFSESMECKFNVNDYSEGSTLNQCSALIIDFQKKAKDFSKEFQEFQQQFKEMNDEYANFSNLMEKTKEQYQKNEEEIEQSNRFCDFVASFFFKKSINNFMMIGFQIIKISLINESKTIIDFSSASIIIIIFFSENMKRFYGLGI